MSPIKLYKLPQGIYVVREDLSGYLDSEWDALFEAENIYSVLSDATLTEREADLDEALAPIGAQEVWASGVTYYSSRMAREAESAAAGGGNFYTRVYAAERPEIFFKSTPNRVSGPGGKVRIRADSTWDVPEPELTLAISAEGDIFGYTIGNDMSSRSIEGENPLYLPQAKTFEQCASLGPCIVVTPEPLKPTTEIRMIIKRNSMVAYFGQCKLSDMKRTLEELRDYLVRELEFPKGAFLMTGTGIVPDHDFTLQPKDEINITIETIGTLTNYVVRKDG
ncbi:fumarylacetoacetate hydrolase family protein [Opitutia bacterium ISCC 51]|nr:fumarylacetoacetate hydrolase family protein [Opitutae bacterium ISCC 51]QXD27701.1 fumarylacetoacetate hydrolase family protein [Opitutae bacterium ISCC 52]